MPSTTGPGSGRTRRGASTRPAAKRVAGTRSAPATASAPKKEASGIRRLPTWMSPSNVRTRRIAVLLTLAAFLLVPLASTVHAWWLQREQIADLRAQVATQQADVKDLQREQERWRDNDYVIQQARERLKFVKVGETAYTVIDAEPAAPTSGDLAAAPAADEHPWYGRMWGSIEIADAPAAHP